jgi:hypothetical protein
MGYVTQSRDELDPENTVYEEIADGDEYLELGGGRKVLIRTYVAAVSVCIYWIFSLHLTFLILVQLCWACTRKISGQPKWW